MSFFSTSITYFDHYQNPYANNPFTIRIRHVYISHAFSSHFEKSSKSCSRPFCYPITHRLLPVILSLLICAVGVAIANVLSLARI